MAAGLLPMRDLIKWLSGRDELRGVGRLTAKRATIKPSRGHSYKVVVDGQTHIVRISDYYDHRQGVTGYTDACEHPRAALRAWNARDDRMPDGQITCVVCTSCKAVLAGGV